MTANSVIIEMCFNRIPKESKQSNISILTWNLNGFRTKHACENTDIKTQIPEIVHMLCKYDILCLTETWANDNNIHELGLKGYDMFYSNRQYKHKDARKDSGGVAVLVKKHMSRLFSKQRNLSEDSLWLKIKKDTVQTPQDIYLGAIYLPPENSSYTKNSHLDFMEMFEREVVFHQNKGHTILCGDMNARIGNLTDFAENDALEQYIPIPTSYRCHNVDIKHRSSIDCTENDYGRKLIDICIGNRLIILNGRTRGDSLGNFTCVKKNGSSLVDYTIVSQELLKYVSYFTVLRKLDFSDHRPILLYLNFNINIPDVEDHIPLADTPGKFTFNEESARLYKLALQSPEICDKIYDFMNRNYDIDAVDNIVKDFNEILLHAAKGNVHFTKCKHRKTPHKPWFDKNMLDIRSNLHFARDLHNKFPNDRKHREDYHVILKYFRKSLKTKEKSYKEELLNSLSIASNKNPTEYWKLFNKLNCRKPDTSLSIDEAAWFKYYEKLSKETHTLSNSETVELSSLEYANSNRNNLDYEIGFRELKLHIRKLKSNKAAGPDLICNEMIKLGETWLTPLLHKLFNNILTKGSFPNLWKKGFIINIHKSGSITDPGNYRGITLTSIVGKLFNSIMNERLVEYLCDNQLQTKFQCGFRNDYRTADNIFILNEIIKTADSPLHIAFIDFKKAFDKLWRHGLLMKLSKLQIGGKFYQVIKKMYSDNASQVKLSEKLTPPFICDTGVRQGDSLSPTLFNIFVDDIPGLLQCDECVPINLNGTLISSLFYADDLVVISRSANGLQNAMNKLSNYCQQWHLEVNAKKSQVMITNKKSYKSCKRITFGENSLEYVKDYKYLGVTIKNTGSFDLAQEQLCQKAIKAMFAIKRNLFQSNIFDSKSMTNCFDAMVRPIMAYGCEVWGLSCVSKPKDKLLSVKKGYISL